MPLGIYGGRADIMGKIAPEGPVYQAGTLSGNPLAVAAGLATVRKLVPAVYQRLETAGPAPGDRHQGRHRSHGRRCPHRPAGVGLHHLFHLLPVTDFTSAKRADAARFGRFFHGLLDRGVYLVPAQLEAAFISAAHTEADIDAFVGAAEAAFRDAL